MNASLVGLMGLLGFLLSMVGVGFLLAGIFRYQKRKKNLTLGLAFNTLYIISGFLVKFIEYIDKV